MENELLTGRSLFRKDSGQAHRLAMTISYAPYSSGERIGRRRRPNPVEAPDVGTTWLHGRRPRRLPLGRRRVKFRLPPDAREPISRGWCASASKKLLLQPDDFLRLALRDAGYSSFISRSARCG